MGRSLVSQFGVVMSFRRMMVGSRGVTVRMKLGSDAVRLGSDLVQLCRLGMARIRHLAFVYLSPDYPGLWERLEMAIVV